MKVGDVVLFRNHGGRGEWEEGVIQDIEGGGAGTGEELYTVSRVYRSNLDKTYF